MIEDIQTRAAALYKGGWRAKDREQMQSEYSLTDEEAAALTKALEEQHRSFTLAAITQPQ